MEKKTLKPQKLYNLQQWRSFEEMIDGEVTKVTRLQKTLLYNVPYSMADGMMRRAMISPSLPGTFYKIPENNPQPKQQLQS